MNLTRNNIFMFLSIIFVFIILTIGVKNQIGKFANQYSLPADYSTRQTQSTSNYFSQQLPKYQALAYLPAYFDNQYFNYSVYPSTNSLSELDIYLQAKPSQKYSLDNINFTSKEIKKWLQEHQTAPINFQLNWFIEKNNEIQPMNLNF